MSIEFAGPLAFLSGSGSVVSFSASARDAGSWRGSSSSASGTVTLPRNIPRSINVVPWGEDNKFPQNIDDLLSYSGISKSALDWKARALYGGGIIPGKITGVDPKTKEDIFEPLDRKTYKEVYHFIHAPWVARFMIEYLQDWTTFANCWPELILSKDTKTVTKIVHQESADCRYSVMNADGSIPYVLLSKYWGATPDQIPNFDPKKKNLLRGEKEGLTPETLGDTDSYVKHVDCIDMYDPLSSLTEIAQKLSKKPKSQLKSAILPVNYPSINKTYYQVPYWDGARKAGWIEIDAKVPQIIKTMTTRSMRIKYHIRIPNTYWEVKYGKEQWMGKTAEEQWAAKMDELERMDKYLTGEENAFKSFVSEFSVNPIDKKEYGKIEIEQIKDDVSSAKDLITSSAAKMEILMAMQVHPALFSAGMTGDVYRSGGGSGSDIREAKLVYDSLLKLEREVLMAPFYLVRDYNREVGGLKIWEEDIVFHFRDTVLTTLDTGAGTEKKLS